MMNEFEQWLSMAELEDVEAALEKIKQWLMNESSFTEEQQVDLMIKVYREFEDRLMNLKNKTSGAEH